MGKPWLTLDLWCGTCDPSKKMFPKDYSIWRDRPQIRRRFSVLVLAGFSWIQAETARADFYTHRWANEHVPAGRFLLRPETKVYGTSNNFDEAGQRVAPTRLNSFVRSQTELSLGYGIFSWFSVYARANWVFSQFSLMSPEESGFAYGLADQTVGTTFRVLELDAGLTIDLQSQLDFPAYSNAAANDNGQPFLGDGTVDITSGLFIEYAFDRRQRWKAGAGVGFTYRTSSFAAAIPWSGFIAYEPSLSGFQVRIRSQNLTTLGNDPTGISNTILSEPAGGSFIVNGVNPSLYSFDVAAGWRFSQKFRLIGVFSSDYAGSNAPQGIMGALVAELQFGRSTNTKITKAETRKFSKANPGFVSYSIQGYVTKVNDRLSLLKIDRGANDGVMVGQTFDIFEVESDGSIGQVVATTQVLKVRPDEAALKITEYYKEVWIEKGFVAKRRL
jgi:hypothetical protein